MGSRLGQSRTVFDERSACAIRILRWRHPPMRRFAADLGRSLDRGPLSRQTVYDWESGRSPVPASVLLAASELVGLPLDEVIAIAKRLLPAEPQVMESQG
jgi:transcriptional regulator with XRE-family HTH domain